MVQPIIIDLQEQAHTQVRRFVSQNLQASPSAQVKVAVGKPAAEILQVAREEEADLIVMGTHGRTGLHHLSLGSVAAEVTRRAPCPMITLRADVSRGIAKPEGLPDAEVECRPVAGRCLRSLDVIQ
jgi:nucleotide-binding universal stress UspA family protein